MKTILSTAILCALASTAQARRSRTGFYFGAGAGQVNVEIPNFVPGVLHFDESANAWKGFAGWNFNENFALEAAFIDVDCVDQNFGSDVRGSVDGEILQLSRPSGRTGSTTCLEIHGACERGQVRLSQRTDARQHADRRVQRRRHRFRARRRARRGIRPRALPPRLRAGGPGRFRDPARHAVDCLAAIIPPAPHSVLAHGRASPNFPAG